jgi:hypothetical protein
VFHQTESKFQTWRALAVFTDGAECLLFVGRSAPHVRAGYPAACAELLDDEERARLRGVKLQCWEGAADQGRWVLMATLAVPARRPAPARDATDAGPALLPFRAPRAAAEGHPARATQAVLGG